MELEPKFGLMALCMKAGSLEVSKTVLGVTSMPQEKLTKASGRTTKLAVKAPTITQTV